ncbi:MFS transporter [Pseudomonas sp. R5(2019)]|uniref:MFS transporter n=1 Tax=Pseudomonas sp. R5(2019) TaxID=2697566 RepID=UPI001411CE16|nr:MFS transporter [Pseudomonas sp. R5(2019)]NBA95042.1 MFS transporter [Pseudomonas sp. R5(2019)]
MQALALNSSTKTLSSAYFLSKCGEFAFETAFAVAVVTLVKADILLIGLVYFLRYLPSALFSPLGGWLADNLSKKRTLVVVEFLKCLIALLFFAIFQFSQANIIAIVAAAMVMTALDCLYVPTFRAYFPDILKKEDLSSANSGVQVIEDASSILGPLIFSLITLLISPHFTFLFFAAFLLLSTVSLSTLSARSKRETAPFNCLALIRETASAVAHLREVNTPLFRVICCTTICAMFATSLLRFILPASVLEHFHSEAAVGYVFSLMAVGTVLGGTLYERLNKVTTARSVFKYWMLYGILFFLAAVLFELNIWIALIVLFFVGFVGAFVDIAIVTNIQYLSNQSEVGRNFSLYYFTAVIGDAVSGLVASLVFFIVGPATLVGMTFLLLLAPLRWSTQKEEDERDSQT